jgi:aspartate aminotransferase
MSTLSQKAEKLVASEIVRLGNTISERIRGGAKIYNYTIGDVDPKIFPIPDAYKAAIIDAYQHNYTNYPSAEGIVELRQSVAHFVKKHQGLDYTLNEIQIASGGRPLIYSLFATLVNAGDKIIYAVPSWNNNHYVNINMGEHCVIEALPENNFMPSAADIAPHLDGAVLLCLCTPQNPTGTTLTREALEEICDQVLEENKKRAENGQRKLYVMYDQIYSLLTYGDTQHHNPVTLRPAMKEFTIFIDGISKVFAATGVRVGWSMGPAPVIAKMKALLSHIGAWAPMAEQKATATYLLQDEAIDTYLQHYKAELQERLVSFYEGFKSLKEKGYSVDVIAPQAAIYLTIKLDIAGKTADGKLLTNQEEVTSYLLDEAHIALVPFYAFGADRQSPWYRLSVGTCVKEDIPQVLAGLEAALNKLS